VDYENLAQNLFTKDGHYKKIPSRNTKAKYSLEYHLSKTPNKKLKEIIIELLNFILKLKGSRVKYTQKRIVFLTNFQFVTLFVNKKWIVVSLKHNESIKLTRVYPDTCVDGFLGPIHDAYESSDRPTLKMVKTNRAIR